MKRFFNAMPLKLIFSSFSTHLLVNISGNKSGGTSAFSLAFLPALFVFSTFVLVGCSSPSASAPSTPSSIQPWADGQSPLLQDGSNSVPRIDDASAQQEVEKLESEELVWADDDFDSSSSTIDALVKKQKLVKSDWSRSYLETRQRSRMEKKPILMWFNNKDSGAPAVLIEQELLNQPGFKKWAKQNVLLLKFEYDQDKKDEARKEKARFLKKVKDHFKVTSFPQLLIVTSDQEVFARYRGYTKGKHKFLWGQLKQSAFNAQRAIEKRVKDFERKGYRYWYDKKDNAVFGKIIAYKNKQVTLVTDTGKRYRFPIQKLRPEDQKAIQLQAEGKF